MHRSLAVACLVISASGAAHAEAIVSTDAGRLSGTVADGISSFKGVPFAAPPVGELRWRDPQPVKPWAGTKSAVQFAPACLQNVAASAAMGFPKFPVSEDCLYLNIWTPAAARGAKLPVMVWIYGGGFVGGSTSLPMYDGTSLAKKGVIIVSLSYRLGALGFLAHPDLSAESGHGSGNYGLEDLIAGLQWVKRNIAAFGGDPERVTIFGESAGATAVSMLAASPKAASLFQRAISESGGAFAPPQNGNEGGQTIPTLANAERRGAAILAELGVSKITQARRLSGESLVAAAAKVAPMPGMWPVLDGYVLPADLYDRYKAGKFNNVSVIAGYNSDEGRVFVAPMTAEQFRSSTLMNYGDKAPAILAAYPSSSDTEALQSARSLFSDTIFGWPTWTWARLQTAAGGKKVFLYHFERRNVAGGPGPMGDPNAGALHGAEISYVFGNGPPTWAPQDRALSEQISSYWVNFAKTGDPNGPGLPVWPAYTEGNPQVLKLDINPMTAPVPDVGRLQVLDGYYAWRRKSAAH